MERDTSLPFQRMEREGRGRGDQNLTDGKTASSSPVNSKREKTDGNAFAHWMEKKTSLPLSFVPHTHFAFVHVIRTKRKSSFEFRPLAPERSFRRDLVKKNCAPLWRPSK